MNRFLSFLKKINNKLDLPQTTKSKIILEMAADLNDLYNYYLGEGLSEKEAIQKAHEKIDVSDEALKQLIEIHQTGFKIFLQSLSEKVVNRWERAMMALVVFMIVVISTWIISSSQFFKQASPFVWPILCFAFITVIIALTKFYHLYIKKDHNMKTLSAGMTFIFILGGLSLFVGMFGYFFEIYLSGGYTILPAVSLFINLFTLTSTANVMTDITDSLLRSSSVGMVGLLMTIFIGLIWFILMNKIWKIEQAECEFLLAE